MTKTGNGSRNHDEAVRITTARTSHLEDIAKRQKRYLLSMSLRSICFVGAVIAGLAGITWLWPGLIAGALVLPYVAVVLANIRAPQPESLALRESAYTAGELSGPPSQPHLGPGR